MIKARPEIERLKPYVAPLEGRRTLLRLDFNENTVGPSPSVVEAIRGLSPQAYSTYPEYAGLTEAYAASLGIRAEHVGAFNGVDAAIKGIFDAYGEAGSTFLTTIPTFGYYEPCAQQHGMVLDEVPYPADLSYPLETVTGRLAARPRLFFVCNPNNPTGTQLDPRAIVRLARGAPETLVVVDELYAPFTGQSVVPEALALDNVVALHSLSKSAGLAALRLGFAVGHPAVLDRLARVTGPYDINALAVAAGHAALADAAYMKDYVAQVLAAKAWTVAALGQLGVRHFAGGGNYLLVWPPGDVEQTVHALKQRGVLVRSMAGKPVIGGSFRLTVGPRAHMEQFMAAFRDVLGVSTIRRDAEPDLGPLGATTMREPLRFSGVMPANILPFKADLTIDEPAYRRHLRWLADTRGVTGIVANGHASEVSSLDRPERRRSLDIALDEVAGRCPVIAGVYSDGTAEAVALARDVKASGAAGILLFPPTLFMWGAQAKPDMVIRHYSEVAAVGLPIIAFEYPPASGIGYAPETLARLAEIPELAAVKDWSNEIVAFERNLRALRATGRPVAMLSAFTMSLMATFLLGADGAISGMGSVTADLQAELFEACGKGDLDGARRINDRLDPLVRVFYAPPFVDMHNRMKEALVLLGRIPAAYVRPPLTPVSAGEREAIRAALVAAELLPR